MTNKRISSSTQKSTGTKTKADEHFQNAVDLMQAELYQSAVVEFHQACSLDKEKIVPRAKDLFMNLLEKSHWESALSVGLLVLSLEEKDYVLANKLGVIARKVDNQKQAIALFKKSLAENPRYSLALVNYASAIAQTPMYDHDALSAYQHYQKINNIYPDYLVPFEDDQYKMQQNYLAQLHQKMVQKELLDISKQQHTYDAASNQGKMRQTDFLVYFQQNESSNAGQKHIWRYNALLYRLQNKIKLDSLPLEITKLVSENPQLPYTKIMLALAYKELRRFQEAVELLLSELSKNRYNRIANVNLGFIYREIGQNLLAAKHLILAYYLIQKSRSHYIIEHFIEYAKSKFEALKVREARKCFMVLIEEGYADLQIYLYYINILKKDGNLDLAVEAIEKAKKLFSDNNDLVVELSEIFDIYLEKGNAEQQNGNFADAISYYKEALKIDVRVSVLKQIIQTYDSYQLSEEEKKDKEEMIRLLNKHVHHEKAEQNPMELRRKRLLEEQWANHIKTALAFIRKKNLVAALPYLERAFVLKSSQETFELLSNTYRVLNRKTELAQLVEKYKRIQLYEKKIY